MIKRREDGYTSSIISLEYTLFGGTSLMLLPGNVWEAKGARDSLEKLFGDDPKVLFEFNASCLSLYAYALWDDDGFSFEIEGVDPDTCLALRGDELLRAAKKCYAVLVSNKATRMGLLAMGGDQGLGVLDAASLAVRGMLAPVKDGEPTPGEA